MCQISETYMNDLFDTKDNCMLMDEYHHCCMLDRIEKIIVLDGEGKFNDELACEDV